MITYQNIQLVKTTMEGLKEYTSKECVILGIEHDTGDPDIIYAVVANVVNVNTEYPEYPKYPTKDDWYPQPTVPWITCYTDAPNAAPITWATTNSFGPPHNIY